LGNDNLPGAKALPTVIGSPRLHAYPVSAVPSTSLRKTMLQHRIGQHVEPNVAYERDYLRHQLLAVPTGLHLCNI